MAPSASIASGIDRGVAHAEALPALHAAGEVATRRRQRRATLALADVVAAALAFTAAGSALWPAALALLPVVVFGSRILGLYERDTLVLRPATAEETPALLRLGVFVTLTTWLVADPVLGRSMVAGQALLLLGTFVVSGLVLRYLARETVRRGSPPERLLLIGDDDTFRRLREMVDNDAGVHARLVGRLPVPPASADLVDAPAPDEGTLRALVRDLDVHRIVIEPSQTDPATTLQTVRTAQALGVRVTLVPRVLDVVGHAVVFDDLLGLTVLGLRPLGLASTARTIKRTFDLAGALTALVVTAPLFAVLAVAIRADSGGPVLLRQERVGRGGRRFMMYKFRTVVVGEEEHETHLTDRDPRMTKAGRWLRSTSLDELPQLLNVLRGEMSLVGPRPLVVAEDAAIRGLDRQRLQLTPGITGPWQVAGVSRMPLDDMVKIDYLYVTTWSLFGDVKLLARTVPYLLARRGSSDGSQRPLV